MRSAREKAQQKKAAEAAKAAKEAAAAGSSAEVQAENADDHHDLKRKHDDLESSAERQSVSTESAKKARSNGAEVDEGTTETVAIETDKGEGENPAAVDDISEGTGASRPATTIWSEPETNVQNVVLSKPSYDTRGHTSYLTFALFYPATVRSQLSKGDHAGTTTATDAEDGGARR